MNRTQRLSRVLRRFASGLFAICLLGLVFSPAVVLNDGFTLDTTNHHLRLLDVDGIRFQASHLGWMLRSHAWALLATSFLAGVLSLGALIRLLHQFEGGTSFSLEGTRLVRILGWVQVGMVPLSFLLFWRLAAVTRALTGQAIRPWGTAVSLSLDGLFWGGITLLVAHVLAEGCRLKAEQDLVI